MRNHLSAFLSLWSFAAAGGYSIGRGWWAAGGVLLLVSLFLALGGTENMRQLERRR